MKILGVILLIFVGSSMEASSPSSPTYIAGVVEFSYEKNRNIDTTSSNLQNYLQIMQTAPANLDIIVFPESSLNTMSTAVEIPEVEENISPCDSDKYEAGDPMKQISCSAKTYKRYVVVNMSTKAKCPDPEMIANNDTRNCNAREDGFSYYNTNIVFDRNGVLVSRYRKFNLFGEKVDKPLKPAMVTFDTDFGVKFGHFICFDLAFRYPAIELVRMNVTDIIFPTMWFSEAPFLTAAQVQQNWAYTNDVNLLAAGANNPDVGSTGTGIYARRKGAIESTMEGRNYTKLYVASVPKKGLGDNIEIVDATERYRKEEMTPLYLKKDVFDRYTLEFLPDHQLTPITSIGSKLCHNDICCDFHYSFRVNRTSRPSYYYALAVYHGNRTFDGFADGGVLACAVLACHTKDNSTSCGERNENLEFAHEWYSLEISGTFPHGDDFVYMPTSLDTSIMPYNVKEFEYVQRTVRWSNNTAEKIDYSISMKTVGEIRDFYAFGIYGRDFSLDSWPETDSAGHLKNSSLLVVLMAVALFIRSQF